MTHAVSALPYSSLMILLLVLCTILQSSTAFQLILLRKGTVATRRQAVIPSDSDGGIIDADFQRVVDIYSTTSAMPGSSAKKKRAPRTNENGEQKNQKINLLDLVLEVDPRWNQTRIPFCRGEEYIDGKLAFMINLDGSQYGIAIPYDDAVAVIIEELVQGGEEKSKTKRTKSVSAIEYVDPDLYEENEEYQELMEIMAAQVQKEFGEEVSLRKTPKVLTISGDLSSITDQWENNVFGAPVGVDDMIQTMLPDDASPAVENELADFMDFMRKELGDEEFEKTMREDASEEVKGMLKFFEVPGTNNDPEGLKDLVKSMEEDLKEDSGVQAKAQEFDIGKDDKALKLISFEFGESRKAYSLVKLLRPFVLVGRLEDDDANVGRDKIEIRFELLSPEEESAVIPRLESVCKEELTAAGLDLSNFA
jgi:hypothetical protein